MDTQGTQPAEQEFSTKGTYVKGSEYTRDTTYVETRITRDGADGYPVEAGRYRLVVARACPWVHRSTIVRRLLGLEDAISIGVCGPTQGWLRKRKKSYANGAWSQITTGPQLVDGSWPESVRRRNLVRHESTDDL